MGRKLDLGAWVCELEKCAPKERGKVIADLMAKTGWSKDTVYRRLQAAGYESKRKRRSDFGKSSLDAETLKKAGALLAEVQRKDGRNPMSVKLARAILLANGIEVPVSEGWLAKLLADAGIGKKALNLPSSFVKLKSAHPNQVHMADPSLCLTYFAPDGKQKIMHLRENYKNKEGFKGKENLKCWRYVLVDHASGSICVRYYRSAGENMVNLWDFLLYAWGKKKEGYAFHGVPKMLIWDKGSANISKPIQRALESLGVEFWSHKAGAPQAKGAVETMNRTFESWFETLLRREPVNSVEELNELAEYFCMAFNANSLENFPTPLNRDYKNLGARLGLWSRISNEELQILPDVEACRALLTTEPERRQVGGDWCFRFKSYRGKGTQIYSLAGQLGIEPNNSSVEVQPLLWKGQDAVRASWFWQGEPISMDLLPCGHDEYGFRDNAVLLGSEFRQNPLSEQEKARRELEDLELLEGLKSHSVLRSKEFRVPEIAKGTELKMPSSPVQIRGSLPVRPEVVRQIDVRISVTEVLMRWKRELGALPEGLAEALRKSYPEGLRASEIDVVRENLINGEERKYG